MPGHQVHDEDRDRSVHGIWSRRINRRAAVEREEDSGSDRLLSSQLSEKDDAVQLGLGFGVSRLEMIRAPVAITVRPTGLGSEPVIASERGSRGTEGADLNIGGGS